MDLRLERQDRTEGTVVSVTGELDVVSAPQLDEALTAAIASSPDLLVADLSGVDFLDSTGLGVLIKAVTSQRDSGGDFAVVANTERITKVFRITGMDKVIAVHADLDAALAG